MVKQNCSYEEGTMRHYERGKVFGLLLVVVATVLALGALVACASPAKPTPTAIPTVAPAAPKAPTAAPTAGTSPTSAATPTKVAEVTPDRGGTVKYVLIIDTRTLDPAFSIQSADISTQDLIFDELVRLDPEFVLKPALASSWTISPEGKTITFSLVKGARFHDGTPVNAAAVKWNFERLLDPKLQSPQTAQVTVIERITTPDDSTIVFNLKTPWRPLLSALGQKPGYIVSRAAVEKYNSYSEALGAFGKNPVGSGPFVFTEWVLDNHISVQRNSSYWIPGKPYVDKIVLQNVPEYSIRLAMMRTGEADYMQDVRFQDLATVRGNTNLKIDELPGGRFNSIGLSTDVAPWNNRALRAALAYAVDRQAIIDVIHGGAARPAYSPVFAGWAYNPDIKIYTSDLKKAKEKLSEAGYPAGITLSYWCSADATALQLCETIQAQVKTAGINLEIIQVPPTDVFAGATQRKFHMINRWRPATADPHTMLEQVFRTGGSGNIMGYSNPEVDNLLNQSATTYDLAQAKKLYDKIQTIVTEDAAHIFTTVPKEYALLNIKVQNYKRIPDLYARLGDVWIKK